MINESISVWVIDIIFPRSVIVLLDMLNEPEVNNINKQNEIVLLL